MGARAKVARQLVARMERRGMRGRWSRIMLRSIRATVRATTTAVIPGGAQERAAQDGGEVCGSSAWLLSKRTQ